MSRIGYTIVHRDHPKLVDLIETSLFPVLTIRIERESIHYTHYTHRVERIVESIGTVSANANRNLNIIEASVIHSQSLFVIKPDECFIAVIESNIERENTQGKGVEGN